MTDESVKIDGEWYGWPRGHEGLAEMMAPVVAFAERYDGAKRVVIYEDGDLYCTDDQGEPDGSIPGHIAAWLLAQRETKRSEER
jgi:hypothetical protein